MYLYTLGAGRILIKSNIIVCLLNQMAWKAGWAHRTGENERKKDNDKLKKSVQTSSACDQIVDVQADVHIYPFQDVQPNWFEWSFSAFFLFCYV